MEVVESVLVPSMPSASHPPSPSPSPSATLPLSPPRAWLGLEREQSSEIDLRAQTESVLRPRMPPTAAWWSGGLIQENLFFLKPISQTLEEAGWDTT